MNKLPFKECLTCDSREYCRNNPKMCLSDPPLPAMTTPKAKEIIDLNIRQRAPSMPPDVQDALNIAIEAIKFCQHFSRDQVPSHAPNLQLYLSLEPPEHPFATVKILKQ